MGEIYHHPHKCLQEPVSHIASLSDVFNITSRPQVFVLDPKADVPIPESVPLGFGVDEVCLS